MSPIDLTVYTRKGMRCRRNHTIYPMGFIFVTNLLTQHPKGCRIKKKTNNKEYRNEPDCGIR